MILANQTIGMSVIVNASPVTKLFIGCSGCWLSQLDSTQAA